MTVNITGDRIIYIIGKIFDVSLNGRNRNANENESVAVDILQMEQFSLNVNRIEVVYKKASRLNSEISGK